MNKHESQAVLLLAVILLGTYLYLSYGKTTHPTPSGETFSTRGLKYVQIEGGVRSPGLYTFYQDPSVREAIERAGGLKTKSPVAAGLLSKKIPTGTIVTVTQAAAMSGEITIHPMTNAKRLLLGIPILLNTATREDLQLIPGVGPNLANRIAVFREQNGPFKNIVELKAVEGIGEKKLKQIVQYVTFED